LEVDAMVKISAFLVMGAVVCLPALSLPTSVQAQSPIPDTKVPGFGGTSTRPGNPGSGPGSSGSDIGSNVGSGATASPIGDPAPPNAGPSIAETPPPLIGASRNLPLVKPTTK
jgi:hypothetical protein